MQKTENPAVISWFLSVKVIIYNAQVCKKYPGVSPMHFGHIFTKKGEIEIWFKT